MIKKTTHFTLKFCKNATRALRMTEEEMRVRSSLRSTLTESYFYHWNALKNHISHDCFLWFETTSRPPRGPITIKHVTWLVAHALLSDSASYHLLCCSIRPGHTPLYLPTCECAWCQHPREHTLWTDADGSSRNSSSRLCLLRGGEGKSGENK